MGAKVFQAVLIFALGAPLIGCKAPEALPPKTAVQDYVFLRPDPVLNLRQETKAQDAAEHPEVSHFEFGQGWGELEPWGLRGLGENSMITVFLPDNQARTLFIEANAFPGIIDHGGSQHMKIGVNGQEIGQVELGKHMEEYTFPVPPGLLKAGRNELKFHYSSQRAPAQYGTGTDARPLAIGLRKIALAPKKPDWRHPVSFDRQKSEWTIQAVGQLVLPLPDQAGDLKLKVSYKAGRKSKACRIRRVILAPEAAALETTAEENLLPNETRSLSIPQGEMRGLQGLIFDFEGPRPRCTLRIEGLSFTETPIQVPTASDLREQPKGHPNIVLIILDAARVDHFGSAYGYQRNTTPEISRLAEDSLVFQRVTAIAPYTRCSVPTMLTGLSFASHGIIGKGLRLSPQVLTLAEILHGSGYQTLAFSGTPNNSIALGFDQGYDEFYEVWKISPYEQETRGFRVAHLIRDRFKKGLDQRPFHLLIHIVPPHIPYEPRPPYDLFTDPAYSGTASGTISFLQEANARRIPVHEADRQHVMDLYDGNLRMGDAAVSEILSLLRSRADWENTLVAITSDHGEAFREHGFFGHNLTVYEEMLRVPLILHLPQELRKNRPNLERDASLEDLCPTLLRCAGLKPDPRSHGRNLLNPNCPERWLCQRTGGTGLNSGKSLRGFGWKLIIPKFGHKAELYDLHTDPHERQNLSETRAELTALVALRLLKERRKFQFIQPEKQDAPLSSDDRKSLRALGYLD